jgi:hypothetical protein
MPATLTTAIVTWRPDPALLESTVASLARAAGLSRDCGSLSGATLYLIDNGPPGSLPVVSAAAARWDASLGAVEIVTGHGNLGYGRANNLVVPRLESDVHLVLNPDVEIDPGAIDAGLRSLTSHSGVGLLAPAAFAPGGQREYLCKRYPTPGVLLLRGFAPASVRKRFSGALARYEMRDVIGERFVDRVPLASGCFLLVRTPLMKALGGFDPRYFMYFEDYDLSLRVAERATVAYEPAVRIVHHGGDAARKGARHIGWFAASALRFFSRHGWARREGR